MGLRSVPRVAMGGRGETHDAKCIGFEATGTLTMVFNTTVRCDNPVPSPVVAAAVLQPSGSHVT